MDFCSAECFDLWSAAAAAASAATAPQLVPIRLQCCRLPVLATLHLLQKGSEAEDEDVPAWWHKHADAMGSEGGGCSTGTAASGKLVGGSRHALQPDKCAQCSAEKPAFRCKGCSSVAFCSRDCQKANWLAGHKRECSKLRKQLQQQARLEAAVEAALADDRSAFPAESKAEGSRGKAVESNSTPPEPLKVSRRLCALLGPAPSLPAAAAA